MIGRMILLTLTRHTSLRVAELGLVLMLLAGAGLLFAAVIPFGRKPGTAIAGVALGAGAVLMIVAIHFGRFG